MQYSSIKEGVDQIMGGRVLNYPGKEVYQEGQADGIAIGVQQEIAIGENKMADLMQKLFSQGRVEDA